ncbi:hypothetical protein EC9_48650 [Rosistilla ulvae]|uniref:Glycosyl hydrolase-like 10 domain-containing protein n=1 Tax=Rosistilla ulvae TaxID=1930277 RepID=A0A517M6Y8_9BACT|nr:hypothetical protein [Rosistilla ulvae]QDS90651.1 hypothetical protein EC9_48650 [Rosistilla ulvae]
MNRLNQITRTLLIAMLIGHAAARAEEVQPFSKRTDVGQRTPPLPPFQNKRGEPQRPVDAESRAVGFKRVWVEWESERPQRITGKMALRGSEILNFQRLGTVGDEVASVQWSVDEIDIFAGLPQTHGGFVFEADLTETTVLLFGVQGESAIGSTAETHQIDLATLARKQAVYELPGDIRVVARVEPMPTKLIYPRRHLIFSPGETFRFEVLLDEVPTRANTEMKLTATLKPARGGAPLSEVVQDVMTDALGQFQDLRDFAIPLPATEGAYEIDLQIRSSVNTAGSSRSLLHSRRQVQVLVVDESNPQQDSVDTTAWELLQDVEVDQLAEVVNSPRRSGGQRAEGDKTSVTRAVQLEGAVAGRPHILELVCSGDETAEYHVSVLRDAGSVVETMIESTFSVDPRAGETATHQLVFWPSADDIAVLVTRQSVSPQPSSTRMRIYAGPKSLPAVSLRGVTGQRVVAAHLDSPALDLRLGGTHLQSPLDKDLKDWQFYLDSTARQAQLLNNAGYSAAMVTVAGGGGSIYPSSFIEPSMLFDNGERIPHGGGSPRKDVLELMFRMYDRHQMVLIPTVRFDFPLAALESQILRGNRSLRMRNDQQQTWWEASPKAPPQGPYYNPAHPAVQAEMHRIVQELVDAYSHHISFGGVAIVVDDQTYVQFPGEHWGADPEAHAAFVAQQNQTNRDSETSSLVGDELREWRDARLGAMFLGLGKTLADGQSNHKLYVIDRLTQPTAGHRALRDAFSDAPSAETSVVWVDALQVDIDGQASSPIHAEEAEDVTSPAPVVTLAKQAGLLLPEDALVQAIGPAGRSGVIEQIAASDADLIVHPLRDLSLGQIEARRNLFTAIGSLPSGRFEPVVSSQTDDPMMMLRSAASSVARYGYVVNNSAWATDVQIRFNDLAGLEVQTVSDAATSRPSDHVWQVRVEPYDMVAFRVPKSDCQIVDWSIQRDRAIAAQMRDWLATLNQHLDAAMNLQLEESTLLPNADFSEVDTEGQIAHWELAHGAGMKLRLDDDDSQVDKTLCIETESPLGWPTPPVAWARSAWIGIPESKRVLFVGRMRAEDDFATTRVKMVVAGQTGGQAYEESIWIDGSLPESVRVEHDVATDTPYRQAGIQILDLPDDPGDRLQVRFEVYNGGKVWIDQVAVYDRFLTSEEVDEVGAMHDDAVAGIDANDFGPYLQLRKLPLADTLMNQTAVVLSEIEASQGEKAGETIASIDDAGSDADKALPQLAAAEPADPPAAKPSPRQTAATTVERAAAAPSRDSVDRRASIAALDALGFGMIGSEPAPESPGQLQVASRAMLEAELAKQTRPARTAAAPKQDPKPAAKPSLGQRIVGWFRGGTDQQATDEAVADGSDRPSDQAEQTERVSGFQIWKSRRK